MVPPLPSWDAIHPLLVHFPIGLLFFAPALLIMPAIDRKRWGAWGIAGLLVLLAGTAGAIAAEMSGEAAEHGVVAEAYPDPEGLQETLDIHEVRGGQTKTVFILLSGMYAGLLIGARVFREKKMMPMGVAVLGVVFAIVYLLGLSLLARAAQGGGRLVHEFGVHAPISTFEGEESP